ncbi:unnamed protein product [Symbiodinium sp. CCMP2592]|nr:unnamed protein product [Symbiodinium sp. CCMP2592]
MGLGGPEGGPWMLAAGNLSEAGHGNTSLHSDVRPAGCTQTVSQDSSCGSLDVSFDGGTPTSCQKSDFENLKAAVLAGDAPSILSLVESFEQQGLITEGTFHWKVVELAVETQEDVPPHVAGWAIDDALANLKEPKYRDDLCIVPANVSSWRKDLCPWVAQLGASVVMLQETHLSPDQPDLIEGQLGVYGFNVFSVPGQPTGRGGTSGGMAICFRKHLNVRRVHQFFKAGAGFQVAAIRLRDTDCYLVNLYLKAGEGFQSATNSHILANLLAFLTSAQGIYFAAGDLNEDFETIAASSFAQEAKGHWISSGESTCAGGGNIDFGLLSPILAAGAKLVVDWDTPFAPHAALHWTLQLEHFDFKLPQLIAFKPAPLQPQPFLSSVVADPRGEQVAVQSQEELHLLGTEVAEPGLSALFASLSRDVEVSIFGCSQGRGAKVQVCRRPLVVPTAPASGWGGALASFWRRMVVWLQACSKRFHVSPFGRSASLRFGSMWAGAASDRDAFQADLQVLLHSGDVRVLPGLLAAAQKQHKAHQQQWQQERSASYGQWLRQSTQKGMRPLFRSVKAEEVVTVRPFLDAPVQERIYLRWRHWFELWSHPAGVDRDLLASLKHAAQEQARLLHPIDLERAVGFFKKVPTKAPGLDGWTCEMLRNLSVEAVQAILEFFHHCEREASWPDQMVFALIALLPKSEKRERPIALLHILYRAWAKLRWPLVATWQAAYAARATWDKAVPGGQALDVALARLMLGESVRRCKSHLITLFLDMETFYDRCVFDDVIRSGLSLGYPPLVLHQALLTYMGPRFVQSEGALCPPIWPGRGVLAGCPAAPSVSKLVIHPVAEKLASKKSACNLDIWIDDLSLDSVNKSPVQVASDSLLLFRALRRDLEAKGAQISISKTCFVASSTEAAKAMSKLLDANDPQVKSMTRDLGVTSAGGRRRVLGLAEQRRKKAAGRSRKLNRLAIPGRAHRLRIVKASVCSAGLWGHQAQGVSPKRRKFYRTLIAKHLGRHKLGSLDLTFVVNRRRCEDPHLTLLRQHVRAVARVFRRWVLVDSDKFKSTWVSIWLWLSPSQHPWKRVNGPLAALIAYLIELGVQAPQAHHWQRGDSTLTIDWACHDATRKVWHWLLPLWETVQLQRVSLLEGGPGARDLRSACVAWAIGAYEITDDGARRVASITSFPQRPLSVAGAEQQAAYELFARVSGSFDLTVDCKAVAQVVTKKSPPLEGPTPWGLVWSERARARITWVPSHKDSKYYADRGIPEWRRRVNEDVDALCGKRAAGVFQAATKPDLVGIDTLWEEVTPCASTGAAKATKPLNKKQRMLARLSGDEDSLGHQWVKGAEGSTNMTMKCAICGLYLQQINDLPSFDRLMHHPCKGRGDPLQQWNIHSSHDMINMGSWSSGLVLAKQGELLTVAQRGSTWAQRCQTGCFLYFEAVPELYHESTRHWR